MNLHTLMVFAQQIIRPDQLEAPQSQLTTGSVQGAFRLGFAIAGAISVVVVAYAGLRYTLSRGNPDAIHNARETIMYAMIGLLVAITGYGIVSFVTRVV